MDEFIKELEGMNLEQVEARLAEWEEEVRSATSKESLDGMDEKLKALQERQAELKDLEKRKADALALQNGNVEGAKIVENVKQEERKMITMKELRNRKDYVSAYAEYVKSGDDAELRALMTENVENGTIAVPDFVYDIVKTAWDKNEIMRLVRKVELKGNLKVNFEISGTDAVIHTEGGTAVTEETLTEGIATLTPAYVKKWISVTDEVMSMRGEAFLRYIYDELTYRIVKKMADQLVALIAALPSTATATSPNAAKITAAPAVGTVASAIANLSDEATNPVVIMNKLTWAEFKTAQYANNYGVDPFEGLTVLFNNSLPAYASASAGDVYMEVGDLGHGAIANFPNGDSVEFTFDPYTKKTSDLVEILGKEYVGLGVVACKAFTLVAKPTIA